MIVVVLARHIDEAAFLWLLHHRAVHAPHFATHALAQMDARLEAHLDGLRIAGVEGWSAAAESLSWEESGEFFVAAELAFESNDKTRIATLLEAALAVPEESVSGVASALGWLGWERAQPHVRNLLASSSPVLRLIGLSASAIHRVHPGKALSDALSDPDSRLRARALKAVGELNRPDLISAVRSNLKSDDAGCRFWAAWSGAIISQDAAAVEVLKMLAASPFPLRERAAIAAARRMDAQTAARWVTQLLQKKETRRLAVIAAGASGDPQHIPWLIEQMKISELARPAGEAFSMITGLDLAFLDLERDAPADFHAGPTEDPADEDVAMDPEEDLPWPDPALISAWWGKNGSSFPSGLRHLCGKPITDASLQQVLRTGMQRQRAAAALELAMRNPGTPLFEVRARGDRQRALLGL